jgi:hypothetical protein
MIERCEAQRRVIQRRDFAGADGPSEDGALPNRNARKLNRLGGEDFLLGGSILITGSC